MQARNHSGRVEAIQLLRILAALVVAVIHQVYGFASHIGGGLDLGQAGAQASQAAVCAFFFVSGYVMVVSSEHLFGRPEGRRIFWTRRYVRVLPSYWAALLFLVGALLLNGIPFAYRDLAYSIVLVPYWSDNHEVFPVPLLWPGWTLFYELVFYTLFGIAVSRGRAAAAATCTAILIGLVLAGLVFEPQGAVMWMLTRPVILIFPFGVALALWRGAGNRLPPWARASAGIIAVAVFLLVPEPEGGADLGLGYLLWAALPAVLLCIGCVGGPLRLPMFRVIDRLGDASYALYLLHIPMAWLWVWGFQKVVNGQPALFAATLLVSTIIASVLFYLFFERPVLRLLNRTFGSNSPPRPNTVGAAP